MDDIFPDDMKREALLAEMRLYHRILQRRHFRNVEEDRPEPDEVSRRIQARVRALERIWDAHHADPDGIPF